MDTDVAQPILEATRHHCKSLKRLIVHTGNIVQGECDYNRQWSTAPILDRSDHTSLHTVMALLRNSAQVKFFATSEPLVFLRRLSNPWRPSWQVLHLRRFVTDLPTTLPGTGVFPSNLSTKVPEAWRTAQELLGFPAQELWGFLHWAFGKNGIPSLRCVVYGDFRFETDKLQTGFNLLANRNEMYFPIFTEARLAQHTGEYKELLGACPHPITWTNVSL